MKLNENSKLVVLTFQQFCKEKHNTDIPFDVTVNALLGYAFDCFVRDDPLINFSFEGKQIQEEANSES